MFGRSLLAALQKGPQNDAESGAPGGCLLPLPGHANDRLFCRPKSMELYVLLRPNDDLQLSTPFQSRQKTQNLWSPKRSKIEETLQKRLPKTRSRSCKKSGPRYWKTYRSALVKQHFYDFRVSKKTAEISTKSEIQRDPACFRYFTNSCKNITRKTYVSKIA